MLKIILVQLTSVDNTDANLESMIRIIDESLRENTGVDLILFPENCLYLRVTEGEPVPFFRLDSPELLKLAQLAKQYSVTLHLGSVPLYLNNKIYNSSVWIHPDGNVAAGYQKIHLFDIQLDGQKPIRESDVFARGEEEKIITIKNWKIGESICYDLRFSDLYLKYAKAEVDLILIPAAFLVATGEAHWQILTRARAIENQCYVLASAQGGKHQSLSGSVRETFGHTIAISPWGEILIEFNQSISWKCLILNKSEISKVRKQIPMQSHRRS